MLAIQQLVTRGKIMRALTVFVALLFSTSTIAQTPAFDPKSWKGQHAGPVTKVLTLGSAHLSQLEKPVTPKMMEPLLDKLAAYNPTIITHEGLSGEQCDVVNRYEARYPSIYKDYCWSAAEGEKATGLSISAAMAESEKMLAAMPAVPLASDRRKLAAYFLAAGDRPSAQVQWLQLPASERREGDGVDAALLKILSREGAKPNETFEIAVKLAARLGLQRVYAVDDHTADSIQGTAGKGFSDAVQQIWSATKPKEYDTALAAFEQSQKAATNGQGMLQFYRNLNSPATQTAFISVDFGFALKQDTPQLYGRQYVAWYETRNLRMVANIRAAFGNQPGARVLNIVGASHKAYYDAYLDMMHEVQLVDVETVLK
jgi:Family of unknown function (DUF5694)